MLPLRLLLNLFIVLMASSCFFVPKQDFPIGSIFHDVSNPVAPIPEGELLVQTQRHKVLISIIDSGVDYTHPSLHKNIRYSTFGLKNGIKGLGLDLSGDDANFSDLHPFPMIIDPMTGERLKDEIFGGFSHGTHVAGLALRGGLLENAKGEKLLADDLLGHVPIRLLPLNEEGLNAVKEMYPEHAEDAMWTYEMFSALKFPMNMYAAINFAHREGTRVVNMSLGLDSQEFTNSQAREVLRVGVEEYIVQNIQKDWKNILFVFAAGNESQVVRDGHYPSAIKSSNTITVGALDDKSTKIASYTNYGNLVDIFILGSDIRSIIPGTESALKSGTSMAAPLITNLAAKILLLAPCLTSKEIKEIILDSASEKTLSVSLNTRGQENVIPLKEMKVKVANFQEAKEMAKVIGARCK